LLALVLGDEETEGRTVVMKPLRSQQEQQVMPQQQMAAHLRGLLSGAGAGNIP